MTAVDPRVRVLCCPYVNDTSLRRARERSPFSASVRASAPALTAAQREAFAEADVVLSLDVPFDLTTVAPHLRWVQHIGSGVGQYPSAELGHQIVLTNAAGVAAETMAEFVLARVLEHWKRLPEIAASQRQRRWQPAPGARLAGKTVAVIGMGAVGAATARLTRACGMRVIGVRRSWAPGDRDERVDELHGAAALHEVLGRCHVVVLAATGDASNRHLFDRTAFATMQQDAFFVNVARGLLVDEIALAEALASGHLGGAAIDVADEEPLPPASRLWRAPRLAISAHCSTSNEGYTEQVVDLFCENLRRYLRSEPLLNVVNA